MVISWPDLEERVRAELLQELNPELCNFIKGHLPIQTIQSHGVIAGGLLMAPTQMVYTSRPEHLELHLEQPIGRINYSLFYLALSIKYAPIAEHNELSPVGQVLEEDLPILARVGERVWRHTCDLSQDKGYIRCSFDVL